MVRLAARAQSDVLAREYVAGGSGLWYGDAVRALPHPLDDLAADFGADIYDRMCFDPQVAACLTVLKASILEDGLTLAPAVDDKLDPDYALAVEIQEAAEAMLDDLETPLDDALFDMLHALAIGNRVAELKYAVKPGPDGRDLVSVAAIKPKPLTATAFVVDAYMNVVGLLGARPGMVQPAYTGAVIDPKSAEILPRDKFAVFTFRPKYGDPRGTSILRPAYAAWWTKWQVHQEYLKYLAQFAGPGLIGTAPANAVTQPAMDPLGNPTDPSSAPLTPSEAMVAALEAYRNGGILGLPYGASVQVIQAAGNGQPFLSAIAACDHGITKSILTQELATEEGAHQARAAAQVHQDVLDTLVRQGKRSLVRVVARDILRNFVRWNWGEDALPLAPKPSLGTTERQDLPAMMTAVAALVNAGYPHPSQYSGLDSMLGLPPRDLTQDADVLDENGQPVDPNAAPADETGQPAGAQDDGEPAAPGGPPLTPRSRPGASVPPGRVAVRPHERNAPQRRQQPAGREAA
jgi:Protein of unknown function (DUF935)